MTFSDWIFCFSDTAPTEIYTYGPTLSPHDALPICTLLGAGASTEPAAKRAPDADQPAEASPPATPASKAVQAQVSDAAPIAPPASAKSDGQEIGRAHV